MDNKVIRVEMGLVDLVDSLRRKRSRYISDRLTLINEILIIRTEIRNDFFIVMEYLVELRQQEWRD